MKKLKITSKLAPVVASGVLFLTGCGALEQETAVNDIKEVSTTSTVDDEVTTTTTVTTAYKPTTTTVTTTDKNIAETVNADVNDTILGTAQTDIRSTALGTAQSETRTTTTEATTSEKTIKHPGESGYNEFNNHLTDILGEYHTYSYVDGFEEYTVCDGDTLNSIADKFHTTIGFLIDDNHLTSDTVEVGQKLKYRVKDEFINCKAGTDVTGIAVSNGIDVEELLELNDIPEYNTTIGRDAAIKLHRFLGNDESYRSHVGVVNCIYNNRIMGEDVLYAHGYMGASQRVLTKCSSLSGTSAATFYLFDGCNNIINTNTICSNPKKIDTINGIPVAYLRTEKDLEDLASTYNVELNDLARMQWESVNYENYTVHVTDDGEQFITFDGRILDGYNLISSKEYHNDENENTIESNKQLIK